ncbi:MAG TPA: c-type cytochrome [Candidatus Angelobacter sp.]|nr:c-type cytochrome [Candidatus Angelobacter sp.]
MKKFIFGVIIGLLIPAAMGYGYFRYGYAPVATASAPMPFEKTMARMALRARISKEAPKTAPVQPTEQNLNEGAKLYIENCAFCHGWPNQPATAAAKGMFPLPPQLFSKDEMVTDDPVGVTYWKVKNGIRMTGMPGFGEMLPDTQIWQVSLLLKDADKLPASAQAALTKPAMPPAQTQNNTPAPQPSSTGQPGKKK